MLLDYEPLPVYARRFIENKQIEGARVYDRRGHYEGKVRRLILGKVSGRVAFVIIAFRSSFGIGEGDHHALAWGRLHYDLDLAGYKTDVTEEVLKSALKFPLKTRHNYDDDPGFQAYYRIPASGRAI